MDNFCLKDDYETGISAYELARKHGVTPQTIYRRLRRLGVTIRTPYATNKRVLGDAEKEAAWNAYRNGMNREEAAAAAGVTVWVVRTLLKGNTRSPQETADIITARRTHKLTECQTQCILGSLLGDASLIARRNSYELAMSHCDDQIEYIEHKRRLIGGSKLVSYIKNESSYSAGSISHRFAYQNKGALRPIADLVLRNGKKMVSTEWLDKLTLEGIAYWFMDDGSSTYTKHAIKSSFVRFSTLSFTKCEVTLLVDKLRSYDISARLNKSPYGFGWLINVSTKSSQDFYDRIAQYVLPCMQYKLKPSEAAKRYYSESKYHPRLLGQ